MSREEISRRVAVLITDHFARFGRKPLVAITDDATFSDLGCDSLDTLEIVMELESAFDIEVSDDESERLKTFGQAAGFLAGRLAVGA